MTLGLLIDSSSDYLILGLIKNNEVLEFKKNLHANQLSTNILPSVQVLFSDYHLSLQDLKYIVLGIGPGSYTGTRVGAAIAESMSYALQIPLICIPSLLFFVKDEGNYIVYLKAKSGKYFAVSGNSNEATYETYPSLTSDQLNLLIQNQSNSLIYCKTQDCLSFATEHLELVPTPHLVSKIGFSEYVKNPSFNLLSHPPKLLYLQEIE